jgi:two-component system NtrC family sensor kinase
LERQREALYQSQKLAAMGTLLAGVAHELNNPLSIIMGQVDLIRRAPGAAAVVQRAEKIATAGERCARIVRNFLSLARQRPRERRRISLNSVIGEALELLAYPLRVDGVELALDLASDLPPILADADQLHQVIMNLVTNAQQAMRDTTTGRRITITTRLDVEGSLAVLSFCDTGPGIPREVQSRIFEPFFTTKPPGEGTGLGLSLCHEIIEGHGGALRLKSEPGHGATFVVEVPIGTGPETPAPAERGRPAVTLRKTILVVDDEPDLSDTLAEMLPKATPWRPR